MASRRSKRLSAALSAWLACAVVLAPSRTVRADELDRFEAARRSYEIQDYPGAAAILEELVGGAIPGVRSRPLLLESRKYLAATYLFLGRRPDAETQVELLLGEDATYELDPLAFPRELHELFEKVRLRLFEQRRAEEEESRRREEDARRRQAEELLRERERIRRLEALAGIETVERQHSRWIAMLPFGIGQFQNGDAGLGTALAVTQGLLAAASITTFVLHRSLPSPNAIATSEYPRAAQLERAYTISNWAATGLLGLVAVIGIVDAQIRFKPVERFSRSRSGLAGAELSLQPTGASFRLTF